MAHLNNCNFYIGRSKFNKYTFVENFTKQIKQLPEYKYEKNK